MFLTTLLAMLVLAVCSRQVALTVGEEQIVICILVGRPASPDWDERQCDLAREMESSAARMAFDAADKVHRRGFYRLKSHGISHGGGQKVRATYVSFSCVCSCESVT